MKYPILACFILFGMMVCFSACTNDKMELAKPASGYPEDIEPLIVNRCAIDGCHNSESKNGASGLNLATWNDLFSGSRSGAVVVPYRSDFSTLCYFTNTDTLKGIVLSPTMPYNDSPLEASEYDVLRNWIESGAPDKSGYVKFSDYFPKPCLYVCNKGCDIVSLIEPSTGLIMRCIDVGNSADNEGPCMVKVSPDKQFWYVIFGQGNCVQKFRTADNSKVGEASIGTGIWNSITVSPDSRHAFISDADFNGRILYLNLETMQVEATYDDGLRYPGGLCLNSASSVLYATSLEGNFIYKIDLEDALNPVVVEVSLETGVPPSTTELLNPVGISLSHDGSRIFVVCNKTAELRIIQTGNDSLLAISATGSNPEEVVYSQGFGYIFVSCFGVPGTNKKSMISVFDYITGTPVEDFLAGHDSKGIYG